MPTQAVQNASFAELFGSTTRFVIPYFQRGYAWDRRQWDQLVADIDEQIIAELDRGAPVDKVDHFFGPVVVLQRPAASEGETEYLVIDGQQRITTIYLLLSLIRHELRHLRHLAPEADGYIETLNSLLENGKQTEDDYSRLKVFSTKGDRLPTYRIVFGDDSIPKSPYYLSDLEVYRPGYNLIELLESYTKTKYKFRWKDVTRLWRYAQALLHCLKVVWIPLDPDKDDPQAIFESLNDRGMPLSACELICSYLFRPLEGTSDFEKLHHDSWLGSIKQLGNTERFEEYLRQLFSIGESSTVGKQRKVYVHFKKRHPQITAELARQELGVIVDSIHYYLMAANPNEHIHPEPELREVLTSIHVTRMESSVPFVMAVLKAQASGDISLKQSKAMLGEVLTLLVRRKIGELPTSGYDDLFPDLFNKLKDHKFEVKALHDIFRKKSLWVSDEEFIEALTRKPLYRSRDIPFSLFVLIELDKQLPSPKQSRDYSGSRFIEHVMPETLNKEWRDALGADATHELRESLVHSLGNLCLLSDTGANPPSTDMVEAKRAAYEPISALAQDVKASTGPWNLDGIRARSARLAPYLVKAFGWGQN